MPNWVSEQLVESAKRGHVESISAVVYGAHPHVQRFARTLCATPRRTLRTRRRRRC